MSDYAEEIRVPPVIAPPRRVAAVKPTVVAVVVGGWLKDQTARTLQPALREAGIQVASPEGWDDWQAPVASLAKEAMGRVKGPIALALVGHSFGGQAVCDAVGELAREGIFPRFVGLIDPVSPKMGIPKPVRLDTTFRERGGVLKVYYRWFLLGPVRANVVDGRGGKVATLWRGCRRAGFGHNTMCHCGSVVGEVVEVIKSLGR